MAYTRKTWENRNTEFDSTYLLTNLETGEQQKFDIEPFEGVIYTDGDPFNAATMNNLEQRIADGIEDAEAYTGSQVASLHNSLTSTVNSLDAQNVKLTNNQTISGVKTFSALPVLSTDPASSTQAARKSYVDNTSTAAASTASANAVNSAKDFVKTTTVTNNGWESANGYYQKTTTLTVPSGYDGNFIDLYADDTVVYFASTPWVVNVSGTVYLRCATIPNGNVNIRLSFKQTRSS